MDAPTQGNVPHPRCPACGAEERFLTPACNACGHEHTPLEILEIAGGLVQAGMPRRSVRRQIAESVRGRAPDLLAAVAGAFEGGGQGVKLVCLMVAQDFGEPRAIPPAMLEKEFEKSSPAVQAEIVMALVRSESDPAIEALRRLRSRTGDPRVLDAFDDPYYRSVTLPLAGEMDADEPGADAPPEWTDEGRVLQVAEEDVVGSDPADGFPLVEGSPAAGAGPALRLEEVSEDGFHPVEIVDRAVPPPIPVQPAGDEAAAPAPEAAPAPVAAPAPEMATVEAPPRVGRSLVLYLLVFAVIVALGSLVAVEVGKYVRAGDARAREAGSDARAEAVVPPADPPVEAAGTASDGSEAPAPPAQEPESHILAFDVSASSQHKKYPASNVADGDPGTVWQEDRKDKPLRKYLFLTFEQPVTVTRIGMIVGFDRTEPGMGDLWLLNNRLSKAEFAFSDGKVMFHEFEDARGMQYFDVSPPHASLNLKITVLEVLKGTWFYDNAVSEVEVWGYEETAAGEH